MLLLIDQAAGLTRRWPAITQEPRGEGAGRYRPPPRPLRRSSSRSMMFVTLPAERIHGGTPPQAPPAPAPGAPGVRGKLGRGCGLWAVCWVDAYRAVRPGYRYG